MKYLLAMLIITVVLLIWLYIDVRKHPAQYRRQKETKNWCEGCSLDIDAVEVPAFLQKPFGIPEQPPLPSRGRITELEFVEYSHKPDSRPPIHIYYIGKHEPAHPPRAIDYRDEHGHFIKKGLAQALNEYSTLRDVDYILFSNQCFILHNFTKICQ